MGNWKWTICWRIALTLIFAPQTISAQTPVKQTPAHTASDTVGRVSGFDGEWEGTLHVGEAQLKLVLHLASEKGGELRAKLDSPEQGVYGMEATSASREQNNLRFELSPVGASFEGKLAADGRTISGTWKQGGEKLSLVLNPGCILKSRWCPVSMKAR